MLSAHRLSVPSSAESPEMSNAKKRFRTKLEIFKENPFEPSLKTHKLSGKLKDYWSFSVEYDLRIIFYFADKEIVFVDIGTHKEVY